MRRNLTTIFILALSTVCAASLFAAKKKPLAPSYAWTIEPPLGLRIPSTIDTVPDNYSRQAIPAAGSDAWVTTGNLGTQGMDMIWLDRQPMSDFFFRDALNRWLPTLGKMRFYNTRIPMTLLSYNTGGGRDNAQDRLGVTFSGNINKQAQVGALLDYLYSKGSYANLSTKDMIWGFSGSYIGSRYEFQGFFNHYNMLNKENGGITDPLYITDPALVQGGVTSVNTKTIPTHLSNAHTRLTGQQAYFTNRYKVGYWHREYEGDSVVSEEYIPVTSFIWTFNYEASKHTFRDEASGEISNFFTNIYLDPSRTIDRTSYWTISNTFGISLLEGFHKYAKFGLGAFVTYDIEKYTQNADTLIPRPDGVTEAPFDLSIIEPTATEHNISIGGQLSKQRGSLLTYNATARFGIAGRIAGDVSLDGEVRTRFPLLGDSASIVGRGSFTNLAAPYLMNNYLSNHFAWHNDFGKERTLRFGGEIALARTGTRIEVEASNVQNHIFFNSDFLPEAHSGSVQIFTARLHQNLKAGPLHWDNRITYQTTSNADVIPLPTLAVYSNLYVKFKVATLFVQFGIDCNYYTKYYAPKYQPATSSFAVQNEQKFGNYPYMNLYANCKLSKARFFILFSHLNQGWFSRDYFSMPDYPLNPRRFQLGVSVDFAN